MPPALRVRPRRLHRSLPVGSGTRRDHLLATGEARAPADIAARAEAGDRGCALTLERYEGGSRARSRASSIFSIPRSSYSAAAFRDRAPGPQRAAR